MHSFHKVRSWCFLRSWFVSTIFCGCNVIQRIAISTINAAGFERSGVSDRKLAKQVACRHEFRRLARRAIHEIFNKLRSLVQKIGPSMTLGTPSDSSSGMGKQRSNSCRPTVADLKVISKSKGWTVGKTTCKVPTQRLSADGFSTKKTQT